MRFTARTILLALAVVLFIVALFTEENWPDLVALGLAAFAAGFVVEDLGIGREGFGTRT